MQLNMLKSKKGSAKIIQKIEMVRKCKGVMLPNKLLGEKGRPLMECGRIAEERSIFVWKLGEVSSTKLNKGSKKVW